METSHGDTDAQLLIQHLEPSNVIGGRWIHPQTFLQLADGTFAAFAPIYRKLRRPLALRESTQVVKWQQMEYFPDFYDNMTLSRDANFLLNVLNRKLKVHRQAFPPGNTSFKIENWITDVEKNEPIIVTSFTLVQIDLNTRRPIPLPSPFRTALTPDKCRFNPQKLKMAPCNQRISEIPLGVAVFIATTHVNVRQIDDNNHVNQSEYFNFCFDCISEAFMKSFFGDLGSIFDHNLRRITFLYVNECFFGDRIETICWQISGTPLVFKFHCKNQKGIVCQTEFEFFPKLVDKPKL